MFVCAFPLQGHQEACLALPPPDSGNISITCETGIKPVSLDTSTVYNMATALRARASTDYGLSPTPRCASIACPLQSFRSGRHISTGATRSVSRRGLALQATCLDQVDFGVSQTTGANLLGGNAAKLLLRRNEVKDQRKRWSSSKITGDPDAASAQASSALAAKLADRQPTLARIVLRAQQVKDLTAYHTQGPGMDAVASKRIRSRCA